MKKLILSLLLYLFITPLPVSLGGKIFPTIFLWQKDPTPAYNNYLSLAATDPLHGVYGINNALLTTTPMVHDGTGNFNNFADAIFALNSEGLTASVTFNVASGAIFAESPLTISATGTAANSISFQKSGVAKPVINFIGTSTTDAAFRLNSSCYITFDGLDIRDAGVSPATYTDRGFDFVGSPTTGCQYNTVKNCDVDLTKGNINSRGIYFTSTATQASGANSYNKFFNNEVRDSYYGYYLYGTSAALDIQNEIGTIAGGTNTISNIGGTSTIAYGIYSAYQTDIQIFNTIITGITNSTGAAYGIYLYGSGSTHFVHDNDINNISTTGSNCAGIFHSTGATSNISIYNNKINNLVYTGLGANVVYGIHIGSGASIYIYNNYIYDLKAPAATSSGTGVNVRAISLTGGSNAYVYNNTVYLNYISTGVTNQSAALYLGANPTTDLRSNIFVNNVNSTASTRAVAFYKATAPLANISNTTNNNLYYAGTPGLKNLIFYNTTNSDQTLTAYKTHIGPYRENGSVTENPPFVSSIAPFDLHLSTTTPTVTESGGGVINLPISIVTDYDGNPRFPNSGYPDNPLSPAVAPDLGADEFGGRILDLEPPIITYSPLTNTSLTGNRLLIATITDAKTGVPVAGAGLPVLYWKINSGAWNNVQGVSMGGNQYTYLFGSGVATSDIVSYYISAQDLVTIPNVGTFPFAGASGFSVNPPACSTPPTSPSTYLIISGIAGVFPVGTGQVYPTLTAAIADLNAKEMVGPVTFVLYDALYTTPSETFPILINPNPGSSGLNVVTIKPNTGVVSVITGSINSGRLFTILNSHTLIDGSNSGGTSRDLTISNTSTTSPSVIILGSVGTTPLTNVSIKNTKIINGSNSSSALIISDGISPGVAGYFNDIVIQNNSIQRAYIGIYSVAVVTPLNGSGLTITGNDLNTAGVNSIRLCPVYIQGVEGAVVSGNIIGNIDNTIDASNLTGIWMATGTTSSSVSGNLINSINGSATGPRGIAVSPGVPIGGNDITGNKITNLTSSSSVAPYGIYFYTATAGNTITNNTIGGIFNNNTNGYGARGIYAATGAASSLSIVNNVVYDVRCSGNTGQSFWGIGIGLEGATSDVTVCFNSVNMSGSYSGYNAATVSTAFYAGSSATFLNVRNNIFVNSFENTANPGAKSYSVYSAAPNTAFTTINYNNYFTSGPQGTLGNLGADIVSLADWKTATGQDINSMNINPLFTSSTDLHPVSPDLNNKGILIPGFTLDHDLVLRGFPPDPGAFEFSFAPDVITVAATGITGSSATINGNINAGNEFVTTGFDYGLTTAYGISIFGIPSSISGTIITDMNASLVGLLPNTQYNFRAKGTANGVTIYGANLTFTTSAIAPAVVTNPATTITTTGAQLNGTVNANNSVTTVTFEYGLTTAYGTTVTSVGSPVYGYSYNPVSYILNGLISNTTYHYRVVAVNFAGITYGGDISFMTACPMPVDAGVISGPAGVCKTMSGYVYTIPVITNATGYVWILPSGFNITSGSGTNSISVSVSGLAVSGNISVYGTNLCGNGISSGSFSVTVNDLPVPTITGSNILCINSGYYIYSTQPGMNNYLWTISPGGIINFGLGTNEVWVTWNSSGTQWISANFTNASGCSPGSPVTLNVTVNILPLAATNITGLNSVCGGVSGVVYSTDVIVGATTYIWTFPAGVSQVSGVGTNIITANFAPYASSGSITVYGNNTCGNGSISAPFTVAVSPLPAIAGTITGSVSVCEGSTGKVYSVGSIANATGYTWTVPAGALIVAGANTNSIKVDFTPGAVSGKITVAGTNICGSGLSAGLDITINTFPEAPVIIAVVQVLTSNSTTGNQWYYNGTLITGATAQEYTAELTGWYWAVVTTNGCRSDTSNNIFLIITGTEEHSTHDFVIFPVPNQGLFNVTFSGLLPGEYTIKVYNILSEKIYQSEINVMKIVIVDLRPAPNGIYSVVILGNNSRTVRKIVINR